MGTSQNILVVDDEADVRLSVKILLARAGLTVLTAENGHQAMQIINNPTHIDLIILDLIMPGMNGFQMLQLLRGGAHRSIPVIVLSAHMSTHELLAGHVPGANLYLAKPFRPEVLLKAVEYLVGEVSEERHETLELELKGAEGVFVCEKI